MSAGADLYDVTLSDGDCRLRVTLDPSLNQLVERNVLRSGSRLRNATFAPALAVHHPECGSGDRWVRTAQVAAVLALSALIFVFFVLPSVSSWSGSRWRRWREEKQCWGAMPVTICLGLDRQNLQVGSSSPLADAVFCKVAAVCK